MSAASINFDGYNFDSINFEINKDFDENSSNNKSIMLDFNTNIQLHLSNEQNKAKMVVAVSLFNDKEKEKYPFILDVVMNGYFSSENNQNLSDFSSNMLSIMFPYIRNAVTSITSTAGVNPIILPTINANEIINESNKEK